MVSVNKAQQIKASTVPAQVSSAFKTKFPGAKKVVWEKETPGMYEVNFTMKEETMSAAFDSLGNWTETETEIKVSALPEAVKQLIKEQYAGYKINEAAMIEKPGSGKMYEAEIEKGEQTFDLILTAEGKLLEKKTMEEKED